MNARLVSAAADLICWTMKARQTAAGIAAALDAAGLLQSPETAAETEHLRARVAELESAPPLAWGRDLDADDLHALLSDMATALLGYWHDDSDPAVLARVDAELARHKALAIEKGQEFTPSPWQRAADGLNALVHAGIGFHIEPDGHISNPVGDEHIEWDRDARRWRLVRDDEAGEVPVTAEQIEARRQDYRATMRAAGGDLP